MQVFRTISAIIVGLKGLFETICSNLHPLITFLSDICERDVKNETFLVSLGCLQKPVDDC